MGKAYFSLMRLISFSHSEEALTVQVAEGIAPTTAYYENGVFYARLEPLDSQTRYQKI